MGIDIAPGRYRCEDGRGGWWVRFTGPGGDEPVGSWPLPAGPAEIDISPGDFAFETHVRTSWRRVADAGTGRTEPRPVPDPTLRAELDPLVRRRRPLVAVAPFTVLGAGFAGMPVLGAMWLLGMTMLAALVAIGSPTFFLDLHRAHELDKRRDRFVMPDELDEEARSLLTRTQAAVDAVRESQVNREGMLERAENALVLPREEWEVARTLARQSRLRAEVAEPEDELPEVAAALRGLREKLELSVAAVTRRVEALERYAERVRAADEVLRAQRRVADLAERAHEYDALLAETVRDDMALPEIERLTGRSEDVLRVLRERLKESAPDE
ncbi:hypothetical protein DZF91_35635 [Actinomadura logoneensis]|uniref:Uncharacterized protein n=1 Tax=Actinomadura logoneensis TaxID=2293572 RepID=A0A372JA93_9ACTN|nr:hypothetical protein DZF91_35635 [Actinomadura logoneensis]